MPSTAEVIGVATRWTPRLLLAGAVVLIAAAWFDWIGSADDKALGAARKCETALTINLIGDATGYCGRALEIVGSAATLAPLTVARVQMQAASLALVKADWAASTQHCTQAIDAWQQVTAPEHQHERRDSVALCEQVIARAGTPRG